MLRKGESRAPAPLDWVVILRKADGQRPISGHFYFILGGDAPKNGVDFRVKRWVPMLRNFQQRFDDVLFSKYKLELVKLHLKQN